MKIKTIYFGTPQISITILDFLFNDLSIDVQNVITQPDKPVGRKQVVTPSPVKQYALKKNIPVLTPKKLTDANLIQDLKLINADLYVVANYGNFIPQEIISMPKYGVVCFHPSFLPHYRGTTPIQTAILNGDTTTGVTFFLMDSDSFDHGPILYQEKTPLGTNENNQTLTERLFELGAQKAPQIMKDYVDGKLKPVEQEHKHATFTKMLHRKDGFVEQTESPERIWRKYLAYHPWPGIWTTWKGKRLKIKDAYFRDSKLIVEKIQLEGKKETSLKDFKNGYPEFDLF